MPVFAGAHNFHLVRNFGPPGGRAQILRRCCASGCVAPPSPRPVLPRARQGPRAQPAAPPTFLDRPRSCEPAAPSRNVSTGRARTSHGRRAPRRPGPRARRRPPPRAWGRPVTPPRPSANTYPCPARARPNELRLVGTPARRVACRSGAKPSVSASTKLIN